jgi:hypothetical protein
MKKILTLLLIALFVQVGFAQEEKIDEKKDSRDDINTIFTKENLKVTGGYLSPELKIGNVHEDISLFVGGKIGMTFNKKFTLGIAGYGLTNNSNFKTTVATNGYNIGTPATINMGYGGLLLEYTFLSDKKIHFSIPVVVGVGGVYLYEDDGDYFFNNYDDIENSVAIVLEPGLNIELNLFKYFRVGLGASYRLVSETSLDNLTDEDLTDLSFNATFKFGFF